MNGIETRRAACGCVCIFNGGTMVHRNPKLCTRKKRHSRTYRGFKAFTDKVDGERPRRRRRQRFVEPEVQAESGSAEFAPPEVELDNSPFAVLGDFKVWKDGSIRRGRKKVREGETLS